MNNNKTRVIIMILGEQLVKSIRKDLSYNLIICYILLKQGICHVR